MAVKAANVSEDGSEKVRSLKKQKLWLERKKNGLFNAVFGGQGCGWGSILPAFSVKFLSLWINSKQNHFLEKKKGHILGSHNLG